MQRLLDLDLDADRNDDTKIQPKAIDFSTAPELVSCDVLVARVAKLGESELNR